MSKPLRVVFDHRIFIHQKHGGVSRYFARIAEHMPEFGVTPKVIAPLYQSEYLRDLPRGMLWGARIRPEPRRHRLGVMLDEALARPLASLFGADVVHETYHHWRDVRPRRARVVTTVYDMVHELFPQAGMRDSIRRNLDGQLERAEKVICISESTRRDLIRFYPEIADRTEVVLLGFDGPARFADALRPHPRPYILYVGMRWRGYKNFGGLLDAYAASPRLRSEFDLVAVGGGGFGDEERSRIAAAGLDGHVRQYDADDRALWGFYRHAALFAYPSLYEGFGIPPLEAMAADCPTVVMNSSSLPEVCGEAAEYASPDEPGSLGPAMERVLLSSGRADALRAAGRERIARFSWPRCAEETSRVYRDLV